MRKRISAESIRGLRELALRPVLESLGYYVANDASFAPVKDQRTQRWIVTDSVGTHELLVTGIRWFDTRRLKGGGGAIDLLMHLRDISPGAAIALLRRVEPVSKVESGSTALRRRVRP